MKKKLIRKTILFVSAFFLLLLTTSVFLTSVYIKNTREKITSESSEYIRNLIIHLETSDYSYSADIIRKLMDLSENIDSSFTETAASEISSYHQENGENFYTWLYSSNIRSFIEALVSKSSYLVSADLYSFSGEEKKSLLYKNKNMDTDLSENSLLKELRDVTLYSGNFCRQLVFIRNHRFSGSGISWENNSGDVRVLELIYDFSEITSHILRSTFVFILIAAVGFVMFFVFILPDYRFYFYERAENINNSLKEILKGSRGLRIYTAGGDTLSDIGNSINSILDESVKTENEIRNEIENYNVIFQNIPLGIIVLDGEGKFIYENSFIKSLFNGDYEPFPGVFYSILNRSDSDLLFENLSYVISGEKKEYIRRCRLFRGSYRHQFFEIRIKSVNRSEAEKNVIISFLDLSASGSRDNPNVDYFRIEGMSKLAGSIANGLNNILQILNGYIEYLMLGGLDEEEVRDVLGNMVDSSKRAGILTRHLKIFSKDNRMTEPVLVNVKSLVNDLENILNEIFNHNIKLHISDDGTDPECIGDESQLEQVIINLAVNAREAINGTGNVEISTGSVEYSEDDVRAYPEAGPGKYVYIRIKDSGSGIPDDQLRKIFEPFYSTRKKGEASGMGLSISYSIVMNHKGFIHVESEEGKGSIFTVNIPEAAMIQPEIRSPDGEKQLKSGSILFVDDEELIVSLGKIMLEKAGYTVFTASNGLEAVKFVRDYDKKLDLMVIDLFMPGISGKEAVEQIRKSGKNIPVLFISGYAERELDSADNHEILGKPFKSRELISRISELIEKEN